MLVVYFFEVIYNVENFLIKENLLSLNCLWVNSDKVYR